MRTSSFLAFGSAAAVLLAAPAAWACGALPTPRIRFLTSEPRDGAAQFKLDAPIVFRFACEFEPEESEIVRNAACRVAADEVTVELRAKGGKLVSGQTVAYDGAISFVPAAPLTANSEYDLRATHRHRGLENGPVIEHQSTFRTVDERLRPFVAASPLALRVEWYDAPVAKCGEAEYVGQAAAQQLGAQICPTWCEPNGTRRIPRLAATVGPLMGGAQALRYAAELWVDEGAVPGSAFFPFDAAAQPSLHNGSTVYLVEGAQAELHADLIAGSGESTLLCARLQASDAAGHVLAEEQCRTLAEWRGLAPDIDRGTGSLADAGLDVREGDSGSALAPPARDAGHAARADAAASIDDQPSAPLAESGAREGCNTSGPTSSAALAMLVALLRRRRR